LWNETKKQNLTDIEGTVNGLAFTVRLGQSAQVIRDVV
jgi:hypothetical protein